MSSNQTKQINGELKVFKRCKTQTRTKMIKTTPAGPTESLLWGCLLILTFLLACQHQQVDATGVFELEILKIQQLIDGQPSSTHNNKHQESATQEANLTNLSNDEQPAQLIRVIVCLKEAFASHFDGPCTYGNASITLSSRDHLSKQQLGTMQELPTIKTAPVSTTSDVTTTNTDQTYSNQTNIQQQGSLLTNVVRILFTFRWTVSLIALKSSHL